MQEETEHVCRCCGIELTEDRFPASRLEAYNWICTPCSNRARDANTTRYLTRKFSEYLRRQPKKGMRASIHVVRQVLQEQPIPQEANGDLRKCCIILNDKDQPVLVLSKEAFIIAHARRFKRKKEEEEKII